MALMKLPQIFFPISSVVIYTVFLLRLVCVMFLDIRYSGRHRLWIQDV